MPLRNIILLKKKLFFNKIFSSKNNFSSKKSILLKKILVLKFQKNTVIVLEMIKNRKDKEEKPPWTELDYKIPVIEN